jgi:F-type H+-transporting ATPase subunit b
MPFLSTVLLSGGSIIDLDGTIFVQAALFFVAFFVLRSLVFKPAIAVFEAREEAIDGARAQAKQLESEAKGAGSQFDEEMRKVRIAAGEERDRLRGEGHELERKVLDQVRADTEGEQKEASRRIEAELTKLRDELETKVPTLAREIASKLLRREVQ